MTTQETTCLRCGNELGAGCRLICRQCFKTLPVGLRQQWAQAKTEKARRACVNRVRVFVLRRNKHDGAILEGLKDDILSVYEALP